MNDLNKYPDVSDEYPWDDSDELPGDVLYLGSLLDEEQNIERRKIDFDPETLIDEPPMITTELYPWKLEIRGDVIHLLASDGKPVITYVADPQTNILNVLFENQNIDSDDSFCHLKRDCCRAAGESFSCTIECRSTYELEKCVSGFLQLTAGGYALPNTNVISLDLSDVERIIAKGTEGIYRTALADPAELKTKTITLLRSVLNAKKNAANIILRFEGSFSLHEISDCFDHISRAAEALDIGFLVMANIQPGREDLYSIDVWAF